MATPSFRRMSSASISARRMTGMRRRRASRISLLASVTAVERTTTSAPTTWSAAWPMWMRAPRAARRSVVAVRRRSLPLTVKPRVNSTSAMPLMPTPPMATK